MSKQLVSLGGLLNIFAGGLDESIKQGYKPVYSLVVFLLTDTVYTCRPYFAPVRTYSCVKDQG
jgi:hypothetical protein